MANKAKFTIKQCLSKVEARLTKRHKKYVIVSKATYAKVNEYKFSQN